MSKVLPLSSHTKPIRRLLVRRFLHWLQRGWRASYVQAESPRRRVPYY